MNEVFDEHIIESSIGKTKILNTPDFCPHCGDGIQSIPLFGYYCDTGEYLDVLIYCPKKKCKRSFLARYIFYIESEYQLDFVYSTKQTEKINFSDIINKISPEFEEIFNQSNIAEKSNLKFICGAGYRKALEHLLKDYSINKFPNKTEAIKKIYLKDVIENYVSDVRIKSSAIRATWLGNDEIHYTRKWKDKDLKDLKLLIDLTVHWIEMETLTEQFEKSMT